MAESDSVNALIGDAERRMKQAVEVLAQHFQSMRTGRPSPELLEDLEVECYGTAMPLKQVASVTVEEGRSLLVQVWDKENVESVDRAIRKAPLDLNPVVSGDSLRVTLPTLSEEMRQNLVKQARAEAEKGKIAVRNVRRDCLNKIKAGGAGTDEQRGLQDRVQKITDTYVEQIDSLLRQKEESLLQT